MAGKYEIRYATEALEDLVGLRAFDRKAVRAGVTLHLSGDPMRIGRSRIKRMTQPFWSGFRLRVGDFRVYYDVDEAALIVRILRVLLKGSQTTAQEPP